MSNDRELREALQSAFPPTGTTAVWPRIEERGRRVRRRRRARVTLTALVLVSIVVFVSVQGYRTLTDERLLVITDENALPGPDASAPHLLDDYAGQLVDPATLDEPGLARIVSGLLARDIPVIDAGVVESELLTYAVTIPQNERGEPVLLVERAERLGEAEAVREGELRELQVTIVDPSGRIVTETALRFPELAQVTNMAFTGSTTGLEEAKQKLRLALEKLDLGPARIAEMRLTEDVLEARQLHIRLEVGDLESNLAGYREALAGIGQSVKVSRFRGSRIAVVWVDTVDEQGRLLMAHWGDAQRNRYEIQEGLVKDPLQEEMPPLLLAWEGIDVMEVGRDPRLSIDPAGDDNENLNDEFLDLLVDVPRNLAGYALEDQEGNRYEFPDLLLTQPRVRLHSGSGTDTTSDLYWGSSSEIWDNDKDTIFLYDPRGHVEGLGGYSGPQQ